MLYLVLEEGQHPSGLARPYILSSHPTSDQVLSPRRAWSLADEDEQPVERYVTYVYSPGKHHLVGTGLGALLGNTTETLRTGQRRALESACLQNHPFGYKPSSLSIRNEATKIIPGELIDVDGPVDDIRQAIQMDQFAGPSPGPVQLLQGIAAAGKELGAWLRSTSPR